MIFLDLAKKRYSVRDYNDRKVEKEKLDIILEAGRVAPTGANMQPQKLIVVQSDDGLNKISKATRIYDAPLAIIVCTDKSKAWTRKYDGKNIAEIDASIVTDHMMLTATDLDISSLWVCWFEPTIIREEFNIPENYDIVNILALGYTDDAPQSPDRHSKTRKPLSETVVYESF